MTTVQLELARNQLNHALRKRTEYEKRIRYLEQQMLSIQAHLNDVDPSDLHGLDRDAIIRMTDVGSQDFQEKLIKAPVGRKSVIPSDLDDSAEETMETQLVRAASNARSFKRKINEDTETPRKTSSETSFNSIQSHYSPIPIQELPKPSVNFNSGVSNHIDMNSPTYSYHTEPESAKSNLTEHKLYPDIQSTASSAVLPITNVENNKPITTYASKVKILAEIEKRGLSEQGLYRVSGSIKEIKELKAKIRRKTEVDFSKISDIHTLTHLVKLYLRELSEPLVTRQLHAAFLECGEKNDLPRVYKLIDTLPVENRHTLAYVILHLRRVARVQENLMDFKSLARVMGPSIVGHACLNPSNSRLYEDTRIQPMLMELFLGISDDYWCVILGVESSYHLQRSVLTPVIDSDRNKTNATTLNNSPLLGRIDKVNRKRLIGDPQYPVTSKDVRKWKKQKFFDSPVAR
ncbi:Rac GTPase-activating protein 1 [Thelohanellus kitauei]|uniref:Rac GTPase-activating protein 1 n=1 Tax=Thelohanellus kitauei TaxID=669202 RepID=A0A0C2JXG5_THEKT|nr:Rac GTPase-activating protein 1 [Thelohanellus kitauei]